MKSTQFILVRINELYIAIPLKYVSEVLNYSAIQPVTTDHKFLLGIINIRGKVVTMVDLIQFLNGHVGKASSYENIAIIDIVTNGVHHQFGIPVDEIQGIFQIDHENFLGVPEVGTLVPSVWIMNMVSFMDHTYTALNIAAITEAVLKKAQSKD